MISTMPAPYREPEDKTQKWIIIFIVLSLLAHVLFVAGLLIITRLIPGAQTAHPAAEGLAYHPSAPATSCGTGAETVLHPNGAAERHAA